MPWLPDDLIRFWRALDELLSDVEPTRWGAVVTDRRFPAIWDTNYARVDVPANDLTLDEVEAALLPSLRRAGARSFHVVSFFPEETAGLLGALSSRGDTLSWDVVMRHAGKAPIPSAPVEELPAGDELWTLVRTTLELFGIEDTDAVEQLMRLEQEVLQGNGKRWFGVRRNDRVVAAAALVLLEGVGYVDNVATFPEARGRGFGGAVTARVVDEAYAGGAGAVYLFVERGGPISMYEKLGFSEIGRLASTRGQLPRVTRA